MDPQTGLPRALLLLLFLHLMPLGGRSHPLGGPSPGPPLELSRVQKLWDHLPGTVGEQQEEQTALEPLQQGRSSKAAGAARQAASAAGLGPRDHVLQSLKRMRDSGCFGGRMDRIGFSTGLGCNAAKTEGGVTRAATIPFTDRKRSIREMDYSKASNIQIS